MNIVMNQKSQFIIKNGFSKLLYNNKIETALTFSFFEKSIIIPIYTGCSTCLAPEICSENITISIKSDGLKIQSNLSFIFRLLSLTVIILNVSFLSCMTPPPNQ